MMGKKVMMAVLLLCAMSSAVRAQGFFNQKASQLRRLAEQIAALQAYKGVLNKGYKIAKTGLKTINGFKQGELNLHTAFFTSLKKVNPQIKKYVKVGEIIAMEVQVLNTCRRTYLQAQRSQQFTGNELDYVDQVFDRLLKDCEAAIDDLIAITMDANMEMKDDERLMRIDQIYEDMLEMNAFSKDFSNKAMLLGTQREREAGQIEMAKTWNGMKE